MNTHVIKTEEWKLCCVEGCTGVAAEEGEAVERSVVQEKAVHLDKQAVSTWG